MAGVKSPTYIKRHREGVKDRKRRRRAVIARDGERCRFCGTGPAVGVVLTLDHIIPISKGGTHRIENRQLLCAPCNHAKADKVTPMMRAFAGESVA